MSNSLPKDIVELFSNFVISNYKVYNRYRTFEVYGSQGHSDDKYVVNFMPEFNTETSTVRIRSLYVFNSNSLIHSHFPKKDDANERVSFYFGEEFEDKVIDNLKESFAERTWGGGFGKYV